MEKQEYVPIPVYAKKEGISPRTARHRAIMGEVFAKKMRSPRGGHEMWYVHIGHIDESIPLPTATDGNRRPPSAAAAKALDINRAPAVVIPGGGIGHGLPDIEKLQKVVEAQGEIISDLLARVKALEANGNRRQPTATDGKKKRKGAQKGKAPKAKRRRVGGRIFTINTDLEWLKDVRKRARRFARENKIIQRVMAEKAGIDHKTYKNFLVRNVSVEVIQAVEQLLESEGCF